MDTTTAPEAPAAAPARPARVSIPGGQAKVLGEARLVPAARPDEELVLQALETRAGELLLRLGYRRGAHVLRGPVSATPAEVAALVALAAAEPAVAPLLPGAGR
jgi:hypothetical protein